MLTSFFINYSFIIKINHIKSTAESSEIKKKQKAALSAHKTSVKKNDMKFICEKHNVTDSYHSTYKNTEMISTVNAHELSHYLFIIEHSWFITKKFNTYVEILKANTEMRMKNAKRSHDDLKSFSFTNYICKNFKLILKINDCCQSVNKKKSDSK